MRGRACKARAYSPIPRTDDDLPAALSFAQERLWFVEQLQPESAVYNLGRAFRIKGPLVLGALEASLNEIQRRHEALRTKFVVIADRPCQMAVPAEELSLTPVDLRKFPVAKRETEARRSILEEMKRPFDLVQGRLLRIRLLRLGDDDHLLALVTHHIVADAWSMGILTSALWALYDDYRTGKAPRRVESSCRYRDYAIWQRTRLEEGLKPEIDYWKEKLADMTALDLPTDRLRPMAPSFRGERVSIELPESLTTALNQLSHREGATLFMTLLAAFQILLCRWAGQDDIAVGAPVAHRERPEIEEVIGLFVSTVVLRTDLSGAPSFRELLHRVREVCLDAYAHEAVPFELLVRELSPQRILERHPLFQVMLVLQNTPRRSAAPAGLSLEPVEIDSAAAQFDLSLYLRERGGRLFGYLEYSLDLFERATIERMAGHLQILLEGIVADPDRSIATLPLLSAREQQQSLIEWNDTAAAYPKESCIHELFEKQTVLAPDAPALEWKNQKITYRELNSRANRLAFELRQFGVGPERLVGVLADRSLETIIGILAILKAGGAYLPLEPHYPQERSRFMLADAGAGVLLTQKKFAGYFPDYSGTVVLIDDLLRGASGTAENLPGSADRDNAAYVIYTSGSTGIPKGVVALHRGAINRFAWMWQTYPFGAREKICQKTSLTFVDSVWEIFGALLQGVPTVLVPDTIATDLMLLVSHLGARGVTRLVLVPSFLNAILERGSDLARRLHRLKYCFCSGETLSKDLAARFHKALPGCRLINLYGSTEVAGDVTCYECGDGDHTATMPIGKPIGNTQIYLLDDSLQPVPIGARGEIYVGGENLARGYVHRPGLTAEKFIANPFNCQAGSRLYRSGDLARCRADGNIEFLGRSDQQVKIRGCRVELGEVESVLGTHPAVRECLVTVQAVESPTENRKSKTCPERGRRIENAKYDNSLLAYIVPRNGPPSVAALRSFLKQKLPDSMLPAAFVVLESMPLLPNGKVDRGALPLSGMTGKRNVATIVEPRTESEIVVTQVWRQVLNIESVAVDDNFFELGGHSLVAAEAASRLRDAFGRAVSVRDLFEEPTVAGLARSIERKFREAGKSDFPPIRPLPGTRALPLSPGQEPLFVFSQLFGGGDFLNMPYAYRLDGPLDVPALQRAIAEIVRRHAALRAGFTDTAVGPKQFVGRNAAIKLPLVDLAGISQRERQDRLAEISRQDAAQTFDLERPPLIRTQLIRLAGAQHILLVTMHHLTSDQWSTRVFRRELAALYHAFSQGRSSPLPELPVQFNDFVRWQRDLLKDGYFEQQISYWRQRLAPPRSALDFRGGTNKKPARFHSSRRPIECDERLFARIKAFARAQNCTRFMVFVAALNILLHRYTGASDIRIGTLVANRGQPGTEGLIGYFVNALVLRTRIRPGMTFAEVIHRVRETCVSAYAHQDLPFEHLETLIDRKRGPLYQVMLNYRNQTTPPLEANGVTIASWNGKYRAEDPGIAISRLDVNFHLRELSSKLTGAVTYKTDLFDAAAMAKFLEAYAEILKQIVAHRNRRIDEMKV